MSTGGAWKTTGYIDSPSSIPAAVGGGGGLGAHVDSLLFVRPKPGAPGLAAGGDAAALEARSSRSPARLLDASRVATAPLPLLGEGAYGRVLFGRFEGGDVAVKVLPVEREDAANLISFQREADLLCSMDHPNIVRMLGTTQSSYGKDVSLSLVMQLAEGGSLASALKGQPPPPPAAARHVALGVARALAYLHHHRGVAHCDIKSGNVLLDGQGGALLADFGVSKALETTLPNTHSTATARSVHGGGNPVGTAAWMAPENGDPGDPFFSKPPSDMYSFAMLLFELATGKMPWEGLNMQQINIAVLRGRRPPLPEGVNEEVRALMEACWAQDASARPSAQEALSRLEAMEWGAAGRVERLPRGAAWVETLTSAREALASIIERGALAASLPLRGHCTAMLYHGDEHVRALAVVEGAGLVSGGENYLRVWAQHEGAYRGLRSAAGKAVAIAALPGGQFAAAVGGSSADTAKCAVEVWDAGTGIRLHSLRGHADRVSCVAALPGGLLASGSNDKTVRIWSAATGAHEATLEGHTGKIVGLAALPSGRLASGGDSTIRVWDVAARACAHVLTHPQTRVAAMTAIEGGARLASGCMDRRIYIWALTAGGAPVLEGPPLEGHTDHVYTFAELPTSGLLASGARDKTVRLWDVSARACVGVLEPKGGALTALAALPSGRLASGSWDHPFVCVWALVEAGTPEDTAAIAVAARCAEVPPGAEVPTTSAGVEPPAGAGAGGGGGGGGGADPADAEASPRDLYTPGAS